jgi:hypothetical protein
MRVIKHMMVSLLVLGLVSSVLSVPAFSQEKKMSPEEQKMMELWMKYSTPGENHKYLEYFVGEWDTTSKSWAKPGAEPMVEKGEVSAEMIMGGRYLKAHFKGSMMGMPAEGMMITGYDNYKKEFGSLWIDSMGTGFYFVSGTLDEAKKIRTETGLWDNFMTGGKDKAKMVTRIIDNDTFAFEMYMIDPAGKEFKSMEMTYKRKK